ncbi:MAG TPA: APC family permease [Micromonosporaceae bacterium]
MTEELTSTVIAPSRVVAPTLVRSVTWRSAVLLAVGAAVLITVSLGPMAAELGNMSAVVWSVTAIIGGLQCLMIAELARVYPGRAGGTATYAHLALHEVSPALGALSSWAYWFAWTPGIAVNVILAGVYASAAFGIEATFPLAILFVVVLYGINYFGLKLSVRFYAAVGAVAVIPLLAILLGVLAQPSSLHWDYVLPFGVPGGDLGSMATWALIVKWAFVAVWASYGAEMASTVVAEMRDSDTRVGQAMGAAAVICAVAFTAIPIVLLALVGVQGLQEDPQAVFLGPAEQLFGAWGAQVVALMLAAGLLLGAQAFVVGSSRTIYQMTRDGYLPRVFGKVNRFGVPVGSITFDVLIITLLLIVFRDSIVDVVASANIGYVVVFVLLPVTYLLLGRSSRIGGESGATLSRRSPRHPMALLAMALIVINVVLLVWGGLQWGLQVVLVGLGVLLLIVPVSLVVSAARKRELQSSR